MNAAALMITAITGFRHIPDAGRPRPKGSASRSKDCIPSCRGAFDKAAQAEVLKRSEKLKSSLLDASPTTCEHGLPR